MIHHKKKSLYWKRLTFCHPCRTITVPIIPFMCSVHFVNFSNLQVTGKSKMDEKGSVSKVWRVASSYLMLCNQNNKISYHCPDPSHLIIFWEQHSKDVDVQLPSIKAVLWLAWDIQFGCPVRESNRIVEWFDLDVPITISERTGRYIMLHTIQC